MQTTQIVPPEISLIYLAVFGVLYGALSLIVVALRVRDDVPLGDGGSPVLLRAIRVHANFAEWVPLIGLIVLGLEMTGQPAPYIHALMGVLLAARVLHPIGLFSPVGTPLYVAGRIGGALSTWLVLAAASLFAIAMAD